MLKYLLGISLLYSMSFCFATEIKLDHESQIISIDGTSYTTAILSEPLSTTYELTDRNIILSNEYVASATSNTVVFYVFDKKSMLLNSVLSITFKPNEGVFVGWEIRQFKNIHINQVDSDLIDELNPPQGYDYQVTKTRDCRNIKYLLSEVTKSYKYCLNANNIYLDPKKGFFVPVFNFSKSLLKMERYSLEKPRLPSFLELQGDEDIANSLLSKESQNFDNYDEKLIFNVNKKIYLNKSPNKPTKMYLIKGDKVTLLDEKTDESGQKWYFINYKGKKDLNMWIKAGALDLEPKTTEPKQIEKPTPKDPAPQTKITTPEPVEIAKQELETTPPKNAEIIKAEKAEPIKTAKGSTSFTLLASMFGLLSLRLKNIM